MGRVGWFFRLLNKNSGEGEQIFRLLHEKSEQGEHARFIRHPRVAIIITIQKTLSQLVDLAQFSKYYNFFHQYLFRTKNVHCNIRIAYHPIIEADFKLNSADNQLKSIHRLFSSDIQTVSNDFLL